MQSLSYDGSEGNRDIRRRKIVLLKPPALPRFPGESAQYDAAEPVETQVTDVQISSSCHFLTIPSEIRFMIYELLLISKGTVMDPHRLMGPRKSVLAGTRPQIKDIDATILRTSRSIYHEALQTLYRKNNFQFSSPDAIESFFLRITPAACLWNETWTTRQTYHAYQGKSKIGIFKFSYHTNTRASHRS